MCCRESLLEQAAELQRQQQELQDKLAELAEIAKSLSKDDQKELAAVITGLDFHVDAADKAGTTQGEQV